MAIKKDFDADKLAETAEQHGKDIFELTERVATLEASLKPDKLALLLDSAADDSKKLDKLFSRLFCEMMEKDDNVKKIISAHMERMDRKAVKRFFGKIGWATWSVIIFIAGLFAAAAIKRIIG